MPAIRAGEPVPTAQWLRRRRGHWQHESSRDYLQAGCRIICALPAPLHGASPTARALRYEELQISLRTAGATHIACLAVSDTPTMARWARQLGLQGLDLIADRDGAFTRAMGMASMTAGGHLDTCGYGLLVQEGYIAGLFPTEAAGGGPEDADDADRLLRRLNPMASGPELYGLLTRRGCRHSARARRRLRHCGLRYVEIMVGRDISERALRALSAADETPQVFVSGTLLGDLQALEAYLREQRIGQGY
ncbi:glutaredoxin domain-containing protein [Alkalilimnicola sp. S0819]|uniref:glutaredoxin domain-containing protein n=1 Tax=Alkalilimnicola sp. S0819 TaxID=2613922 RepID=UPI001261DF0D|nr:glutaredoxin domain-containing protein [Alkalilimnicola sp. S0819]KAB7619539.1 hypothetical protein F3N43_13475 [Alkalilimnicola sp. S0819]MPQ17646.1 hypothetical protein [Alkalilimnicola sp. S0819]